MLKEQQRKVALVATQAPRPTVTRASEPEFPEGDEQQPPAQTTAPSTQEAARTFEQVIDELDDSFQVESRDLAWSGRAEPEVRSQIQLASVEGTRVTAIDCHTTLCRADLVHPSLERHRNFLDSLINHRKWPGEMTINTADKSPDAINENEPVSAVVFFKRGNP
jgi:hypothetical protein